MCEQCREHASANEAAPRTRRGFLLLGLAALAGCATSPRLLTSMPAPPWPDPDDPLETPVPPAPPPPRAAAPPGRWSSTVLPRSAWAGGAPVPSRMNRMTPVRYITIHHDGMDPFFATDRVTVAAHLEGIRRLHRRKGWGDIGYHFAVDRAGHVWEARPLRYQGAHVKDHNQGNIGIVVLGNFEEQLPSREQVEAVRGHVAALMRAYNVPPGRVQSHQEWGARTACPGASLQYELEKLRLSGMLG